VVGKEAVSSRQTLAKPIAVFPKEKYFLKWVRSTEASMSVFLQRRCI